MKSVHLEVHYVPTGRMIVSGKPLTDQKHIDILTNTVREASAGRMNYVSLTNKFNEEVTIGKILIEQCSFTIVTLGK